MNDQTSLEVSAHREFALHGKALGATFVGLLFSMAPLVIYPFGLFFHPLATEFDWSRAEFFTGMMFAQVGLLIGGPVHGFLIDRFGSSPLLKASIVCLAASLASLYFLSASILHFYVICLSISALGASATPIGYSRILVALFDRRRGLALGIALSAVGLGAMLFPPAIQWMIGHWNWRWAYLVLGIAALIPLPFCRLMFKSSPAAAVGIARGSALKSAGLAIASNRRAFVLLVLAFVFLGCVSVGLTAHLVPLLIDSGVTPASAALYASVVGLTVILSRAGIGWLIDLVHAPFVLAIIATGFAIASMLLIAQPSGAIVVVVAMLLGLGLGAEVDLMSYLVSRYWNQQSFGVIYGLMFGLFSIGTGFGPLLVGRMFDARGNYEFALSCAAASAVLVAFLCLLLPRYKKSVAETV